MRIGISPGTPIVIPAFPYYSHKNPIRIPWSMGMVWEAYGKWVPLLGVPGISFEMRWSEKNSKNQSPWNIPWWQPPKIHIHIIYQIWKDFRIINRWWKGSGVRSRKVCWSFLRGDQSYVHYLLFAHQVKNLLFVEFAKKYPQTYLNPSDLKPT